MLSAPDLVGEEIRIITSEYDRFDKTSERLDVLGLARTDEDGLGRLVVIELKRDGKSTTVDLQAIRYAAYVSASSFSQVCEMYASYYGVKLDDVVADLAGWLGGTVEEPPTIDDTPRVVLMAADFRPEVTTTVLWLIDNSEIDIRCIRLQPFQVGDRLLVTSDQLIPLPAAEDYRLGVLHKQREEKKAQGGRAQRLLPRLVEADLIDIGDVLIFRAASVPEGAVPPWSPEESVYQAKVVDPESNASLEWVNPQTGEEVRQSPSLLAAWIPALVIGKDLSGITSAGINGYKHWTVGDGTTLRDLAYENGLFETAARQIDRTKLANMTESIPKGSWTSYGEIAAAIGVPGAAQSVASVIATDASIKNAHRVLRKSGRISPGWRDSDGAGPEECRARLEAEGITFSKLGVADPKAHWLPKSFAD